MSRTCEAPSTLASLEKVDVIICVEDHERTPTVVGHDADRLGERRRVDMFRTSSLSCGERGRMLMELVLDAVRFQPIEQTAVRSVRNRLIAAHREPPIRVAGGLQATATPAAATSQRDTPLTRAPEPTVLREARCPDGPDGSRERQRLLGGD